MLLWVVDELRQLIFVLIPLAVGRAQGRDALPVGIAIVAVILIVAAIRYVRFRYQITADSLVIEGGALFRYRRVLPRARIQSIDLVQKLRHQMLGVVEVRVEVIGGGKTEGRLIAVTPAEAERVRAELLARDVAEVAPEQPPAPLVKLSPRDLVVAGLTGGRVAVLALIGTLVENVVPEDLAERIDPGGFGVPALLVIVAGLVIVLLLTMIVSLIMTVFVYWGFTVVRQDDRLVITRGLLEKRRAVVPLARVQAFRLHENLLHRVFGLASVSVKVAGYSGEQQEVKESSMLLPVGTRAAAFALIRDLIPTPAPVQGAPLIPAPSRALRRRVIRAVVVALIAGVVGLLRAGTVGALAFLTVAPLGWVAWLSWRALGHAMVEGYVLARSGPFVQTTSVVHASNVQVCERVSTPFQRAAGLASLRLRIPKHAVMVIDVESDRADRRFGDIVAAMA